MPAPKADLSRLSISQLATATGRDRRTIVKALAGLEPSSKRGRAKVYKAQAALEHIYLGQERLSLADEQARLASERADAEYLKNAQLRGNLISPDSTDRALIALATVVSSRLQSLGTRTAPALAAERSRAKCQGIVDEAVADALLELADGGQEAQARLDGPGHGGASAARH